jgi:hypothetical protein
MKYYKIFAEHLIHYKHKFTEGLNADPLDWNPEAECLPGGFYFCDGKYILHHLHRGPWISEVKVPEGT